MHGRSSMTAKVHRSSRVQLVPREDLRMTASRETSAPRQRVWDVLADGWSYSGWVVGTSRIRAVDADWPTPGAKILHSIGTWPAVTTNETVVEHSVVGEETVLLAKLQPAATARVTLRLFDIDDGGYRIEMSEIALSRPLKWAPEGVQLLGVAPRNSECTWRLTMIAEHQVPDAV